jgi:hypothetical protein
MGVLPPNRVAVLEVEFMPAGVPLGTNTTALTIRRAVNSRMDDAFDCLVGSGEPLLNYFILSHAPVHSPPLLLNPSSFLMHQSTLFCNNQTLPCYDDSFFAPIEIVGVAQTQPRTFLACTRWQRRQRTAYIVSQTNHARPFLAHVLGSNAIGRQRPDGDRPGVCDITVRGGVSFSRHVHSSQRACDVGEAASACK